MAHMPDIFAETLRDFRAAEQAVAGHLPRHHQPPAPVPVSITAATAAQPEGDAMPLLDTIKNDIADVENVLKNVDAEALGKLNAIMANPEASAVLSDLAGLASVVGIPAGTISGVASGLKTVLGLYAQPQAPAPAEAPAEPVAAAPAQ